MSAVLQPQVLRFTIYGQPYSKANRRKLVSMPKAGGGTRIASVKSDEALAYVADALRQIPASVRKRLTGPVRFTAHIFYAAEQADLDESVLLDVLQDQYTRVPDPKDRTGKKKVRVLIQHGVYCNDRQVKEKHVFHGGIDKRNPRAEIEIQEIHR